MKRTRYAAIDKSKLHAILIVVGLLTFCRLCFLLIFLFPGQDAKTWSECTKKMIDAEFERREAMNYNCFFT